MEPAIDVGGDVHQAIRCTVDAVLTVLEPPAGFLHQLGEILLSSLQGDQNFGQRPEFTDDHQSPRSVDGRNTQTVHVNIETDADAHCGRARAAGFTILAEPETQFYGQRTYRCRDPEGHIWTVGQSIETVSREAAEAATGLKITGWV